MSNYGNRRTQFLPALVIGAVWAYRALVVADKIDKIGTYSQYLKTGANALNKAGDFLKSKGLPGGNALKSLAGKTDKVYNYVDKVEKKVQNWLKPLTQSKVWKALRPAMKAADFISSVKGNASKIYKVASKLTPAKAKKFISSIKGIKTAKNFFNKVQNRASNFIKSGKFERSVGRGVNNARRAIGRGVNTARRSIGRGVNTARRSFNNVRRNVGNRFNNARRSIGRGVNTARRSIGRGVNTARRSVSRGVSTARSSFNNARRSIGNGFRSAARSFGGGRR